MQSVHTGPIQDVRALLSRFQLNTNSVDRIVQMSGIDDSPPVFPPAVLTTTQHSIAQAFPPTPNCSREYVTTPPNSLRPSLTTSREHIFGQNTTDFFEFDQGLEFFDLDSVSSPSIKRLVFPFIVHEFSDR